MVGQKSLTFGPSARRLAGRMRPERRKAYRRAAARRGQRLAQRDRPADPRPGHRPDLRRAVRAPAARRHHARRRRSRRCGPAATDQLADMLAGHGHVVPGQGVDFAAVGARAAAGARGVRRVRRCSAGCRASCSTTSCRAPCAGCAPTSRTKINRLPLSYFDRQPRGELLSPGHQRHRQRQPDAAADDEPAAGLAADRRRRARDDVLDLADARAGRARHGAALDAASPARS